jgi:hypothetical protein
MEAVTILILCYLVGVVACAWFSLSWLMQD